jgi:hypothetical protein
MIGIATFYNYNWNNFVHTKEIDQTVVLRVFSKVRFLSLRLQIASAYLQSLTIYYDSNKIVRFYNCLVY